jgi:hypothetical protein
MKLNIEIPDELLSRTAEPASPPAAGLTDARSGGAAPDSVAVGRVGPASAEQALSAGAAEQAASPLERLAQAPSAGGMDGGTAPA